MDVRRVDILHVQIVELAVLGLTNLDNRQGAHVIFDAAGKPASINASIRSARPGARIVVIGIPSEPLTAVEFWPALHAEVTIKVQKRNNGNDHEALHLIEAGKVTPEMILSHKFSLEDGGKAFATMGDYSDGVIKPWVEI